VARDDFDQRCFDKLEEHSKGRSLAIRFIFILNSIVGDSNRSGITADYKLIRDFTIKMIRLRDDKQI
jgi:hypothetical protein